MNRRPNDTSIDDLAGWEKWPLAALFLANALNIFLLYVPIEEMPGVVQALIPWVRVACGVAAAASLEGTLIAVTMGRRHGRDSYWSWATMALASLFTAAVAYYIHSSIGMTAAVLFMAQAAVLFVYTQHLAQPRKPLTALTGTKSQLELADAAIVLARTGDRVVPEQEDYPDPVKIDLTDNGRLGRCKHCGEMLTLSRRGAHGRNFKRFGTCSRL